MSIFPLALILVALAGRWSAALAPLAAVLLGHISVYPKRSDARAHEKYSVRVPTETVSPTVAVRVEFPPAVAVQTFQPKAGWTREVETDETGRIVAATWSGGSIESGEFDEFNLIGLNQAEPGELVWRAYQTMADGQIIAWTGAASSPERAPRTEIAPAASAPHAGHR
jgi:uncharacterized protein YcnI